MVVLKGSYEMNFVVYNEVAAWRSSAVFAGLVVRVDVDGGLLAFDGPVLCGVWAPVPGVKSGWLTL